MNRTTDVVLRITWDDGHDQDPKDWDWVAIMNPWDVDGHPYESRLIEGVTEVMVTTTVLNQLEREDD